MMHKAVGKKIKRLSGGPVVHGVATAERPTGPFEKYDESVFVVKGYDFPAEDPFIWYRDGKYRAFVKDMHGAWYDAGQSLVLFDSTDGFHWNPAAHPLVSTFQIAWADGHVQKVGHLERPLLYLEDGKPVALLRASEAIDEDDVHHAFNLQVPVK